MKKFLFLTLALVFLFSSAVILETEVVQAESELKVALVVSGGLGDRSFYDSSAEGVEWAEEDFGIDSRVLECRNDPSLFRDRLIQGSMYGDVVVVVGFEFYDVVQTVAPEFPEVEYIYVDNNVEGHDNITSIIYKENEGSFLAGAAAAMFTKHDELDGVNSKDIIGWVGGMDIPVLHDFLVGYKQGAKHIDPDMKVLVSFAGTFNDPVKGKELTLSQYDQGADIVMNVASGTGRGILEAAKEADKYAVGVDLNQDDIYPGHILTSMMKRVDRATYLVIEDVVEDQFRGGEVISMDLSNGGVGLTDMSVMQEALGEKFPQEILDRVNELTEKVKNGEIEVESYEGFSRE